MTDKIQVDILVPTHDRLDLTVQCVKAIYANTQVPFHLIIMDSSHDNLTKAWFNELITNGLNPIGKPDNITFIHKDSYKNGNEFFNIGFRYMKSDFVATVMNSVRVEPEWEQSALEIMRSNPDIGIVGMKCLLPDGTIESGGIRMVKYLPADVGRGLPGHRLSANYWPDAVQWAFCLLRKKAVVANLTEDVFHGHVGWDDIDNCFAVKAKGWKIIYCGQGSGYHEPRATRGNNSHDAMLKNRENGEMFYKRWGLWDMFIKEHPEYSELTRWENGRFVSKAEADSKIDIHALPEGELISK